MSNWPTLLIVAVSSALLGGTVVWLAQEREPEVSSQVEVPSDGPGTESDGVLNGKLEAFVADTTGPNRLAVGWAELDLNGDNQVSREEFGGSGERWTLRFQRRDENGDGFITARESRKEERRARKYSQFKLLELDKDGNGSLDVDEFPGPPDAFLRTDVDGDGILSKEELEINNQRYSAHMKRLKRQGRAKKGGKADGETGPDRGEDMTWKSAQSDSEE